MHGLNSLVKRQRWADSLCCTANTTLLKSIFQKKKDKDGQTE